MFKAFTEFCSDFLSRQKGYFVSPLCLSGSAVESIFGQFKYNARGKLDASNYQVARAALLTKQASECHYSGKGTEMSPCLHMKYQWKGKKYRRKRKFNSNNSYFLDFDLNVVRVKCLLSSVLIE